MSPSERGSKLQGLLTCDCKAEGFALVRLVQCLALPNAQTCDLMAVLADQSYYGKASLKQAKNLKL